MAGFTYESFGKDLGVYMDHLELAKGDVTFAILKAHLALEQVMQDYLDQRLPSPRQLDGLRLMYATKLAIVRSVFLAPDHFIFDTVKALNGLRNKLAHRLEPEELAEQTRLFIRDAHSKFDIPFEPTADIQHDFGFTAAKIFGYLTALLGLQMEFVKGNEILEVKRLS
jgi:hypothetical protein